MVNNISYYLFNKIDIEKKKVIKKIFIDMEFRVFYLKFRFFVFCICNSYYIFMEFREELFGIFLCIWIYVYIVLWVCFVGFLWLVIDREFGSILYFCWLIFIIFCIYINIFIYLLCMIFGDKWFFKRLVCIWFCIFFNYGIYLLIYLLDIKRCNWLSRINL